MINVECDHSERLGAARYQGLRPTCMAFTASDLNAGANDTGHLSVEFLCHEAVKLEVDWQPDCGFTADAVLCALAKPGQPVEEAYPYKPDVPDAPLVAPTGELHPRFSSTVQARNLKCADVIERVQAGEVVGIVMAVTESLYYPREGIVSFDPLAVPDLYHALVVVGVGTHASSGERHVLVRNSWGAAWGAQGHAWIPEQHLSLHLVEGFSV